MGRSKRRTGKKRKAAARRAAERPERQQDPRLIAARALAKDGEPFTEETWILGVSPARMEDGRVLMWHSPQPVAFALIESKRFRDRGARRRRAIMAKLRKRPGGEDYGPENSRAAIDCMCDLHTAVLYAFTAIESLANHAIEMVEAPAVRNGRTLSQDDMLWLPVEEKYKVVIPLVAGGRAVAADAITWAKFRALKTMRNELVHVKRRGYSSDPDDPTAYDRLMLGEADECFEDALAVIDGAWPGFFPDHVRAHFTR